MLAPTTVDDLTALLKELHDEADGLRSRLQTIEHQVSSVETALELCKERTNVEDGRYGIHQHIVPHDIVHGGTYMGMAVEIAKRSQGWCKLADTCRLISDAKKGATTPESVKSSIHGQFAQSGEWDTEPGTGMYQWLPYAEWYAALDKQEDETWPAESSPTGDGDASPDSYQASAATQAALGRITA